MKNYLATVFDEETKGIREGVDDSQTSLSRVEDTSLLKRVETPQQGADCRYARKAYLGSVRQFVWLPESDMALGGSLNDISMCRKTSLVPSRRRWSATKRPAGKGYHEDHDTREACRRLHTLPTRDSYKGARGFSVTCSSAGPSWAREKGYWMKDPAYQMEDGGLEFGRAVTITAAARQA